MGITRKSEGVLGATWLILVKVPPVTTKSFELEKKTFVVCWSTDGFSKGSLTFVKFPPEMRKFLDLEKKVLVYLSGSGPWSSKDNSGANSGSNCGSSSMGGGG
ncbi:hypothetical protein B0H19DRAFT_1187898 [Mycena capillaripes]|nr:hypothetical protein B0H19DRAFT_1187898 [Mycena capillaripes]